MLVVLERRVAGEAGLPIVRAATNDLALTLSHHEGRFAFALALLVVYTSFFCRFALSIEEIVFINALSAGGFQVDQVVFCTVGVFGMAVSVGQEVALLALSASFAGVFAAVLDCADVVVEDEGEETFCAALLVVFFASQDLALPIDCQLEGLSALLALAASFVLDTPVDNFDTGIVDPFVALSAAGALVGNRLNTSLG